MAPYPIAFEFDAWNNVPRQYFRNTLISVVALTWRHTKNGRVYFDVSMRTINRSVLSFKNLLLLNDKT